MKKINLCLFILAAFAVSISAQSGGTFTITQSVVASGGGQSNGGTFNVTGTSGQNVAGTNSSGSPFSLQGGFWQPQFAPTAAGVSVSGRVSIEGGRGLRNVLVILTDQQGVTRRAITGSFGYYRFDDVVAGQTYVIAVSSKRFQFSPRIVTVNDAVVDLDFVAEQL